MILGLTGGLFGALLLAGVAGWQWRQAQIGQIEALSTSSKALFSTDPIASLIDSLEAAKKLKQTFGTNDEIKAKVRFSLAQAVYSIRESNRLENHKGNVNDISFSPDGKYLASVGGDGTLRLWNLEGKEIKVWWGDNARLLQMSFSPDGQLIALADETGTIKLWSIPQERIVKSFTAEKTSKDYFGYQNQITCLSFSPDGQLIASGSSEGSIRMYDLSYQEIRTIQGHDKTVNSIKFSPNEKIIASGSNDGLIKLWDFNGKEIRTIEEDNENASNQEIDSIDFSPDGRIIAFGRKDGVLRLWKREGELIRTVPNLSRNLKKPLSGISSFQIGPNGNTFVIGHRDGTVRIWNNSQLTTLGKHKNTVKRIKFSNNGKLVASASDDGTVKLWNLDRPRSYKFVSYHGEIGQVRFLDFSHDRKIIVTGALKPAINKYIIRRWKIGSTKNTFFGRIEDSVKENRKDKLSSLDLNPKGGEIALGFENGIIRIFNLEGQELEVLDKNESRIKSIKFSPDGENIVFGSYNGIIKLWNISKKELYILGKHNGSSVQSVNFSSNGQIIASAGSGDSTIKIWNLEGKELHTLKGHVSSVNSISFSPDGKIIASGDSSGIIKIWNMKGQEIDTLWGHNGSINSISFSLDGKMLVSGGSGKVKLWLLSGSIPITLVNNGTNVGFDNTVTKFSPDGKKVASTIVNENEVLREFTEAKLWDLELDNLQSQGCYWIGHYLKNNPNIEEQERQLCKGVKDSAQRNLQQGIEKAKQGNIKESTAAFQKALDINSDLSIEPEKEAIYITARTYFDLAAHKFFSRDYEGALKPLRIATELELITETLSLDPEKRTRELVIRGIIQRDGFGKYGALESLKTWKDRINSNVEALLFPSAYNICWVSILYGNSSQALDSCDKIVELESEPGRFRGIRGIAKTMSGDFEGAIKDFEDNLDWINRDQTKAKYTQESLDKLKRIRQDWINDLRIGKNPLKSLTPEEIEEMSQITSK
ncbi:MAG: hypothetical protein AAGA80_05665 [Cyanobacteria bacterium P01_F01_bin.143]